MRTQQLIGFPLIFYIQLSAAIQNKIGILVQESLWGNVSDVIDNVTISNGVEVNITVHRLTGRNGMEVSSKVCQLLGNGYGGFITFVDCPTASVVELQSKSRHIPYVIVAKDICNLEHSIYSFNLFPPCNKLTSAITDMLSKQKWIDAVILHDRTLSSRCLQDLVSRFSQLHVSSKIINVKHGIRLEIAKNNSMKSFVVFTSISTLNETLVEAERLDMLSSDYSWIIVTEGLDLPSYSKTSLHNSRLLFLRNFYPDMKLMNSTCVNKWPADAQLTVQKALIDDAKSVFVEAINNLEIVMPHTSVASFSCTDKTPAVLPHGDSLAAEMQKVSLIGNTGPISWSKDTYRQQVSYQICSTVKNSNSLKHMGNWKDGSGLNLDRNVLFGNDFTDFENKTLTIATKPIEPFVIFTDVNGTISYSGFCFNILNELANRFHFKYKIVQPPDGMYGGLNSDGTWNGMIGMVMRGEVDFAIGPFTITSMRETVIDLTVPIIEDGVGILTRRPDDESNKIFKMFKPFSLAVWLCIGAAIIAVGTMLFIVGIVSPFVGKSRDSNPELTKQQKCLKQTVWLIYGSFVEQGIEPRPSTFSGRSILGFWWLFTILITSTYTANLAAYLTVSIPQQPINSLEELVAQTEIKPLVKSGTNIHTLFMTSHSGIYRKVWNMMSNMPKVTNNEEALYYVRQGKYAFMTDVAQLDYIVRKDCHTYSLADEIFNNAGLGFVVSESALYKDAFNFNMMKMQEAGMMERWKDEWWSTINSCSASTRSSGAQSLVMDSLAGLFYVYVSIATLSVIVFVSEIFYRRILADKVHTYISQLKAIYRKKSDMKTPLITKNK